MKCRLVVVAVTMLLVTGIPLFAKGPSGASADAADWVAYWAKPRVILFGPEEQPSTKTCTKSPLPMIALTMLWTRLHSMPMSNG